MWQLDCEESWTLKNWSFWTVVLEKTLESPFDFKEIQPVHPKGDQSWVLIGRTDVEAETPVLQLPDAKSWLTGKDTDAGKDWGQEKNGTTEDEMAGWHHRLDGHGFGWTRRPGMLQFMGSRRVRHDWATELNWIEADWDKASPSLGVMRLPTCCYRCFSLEQRIPLPIFNLFIYLSYILRSIIIITYFQTQIACSFLVI